VVSLAADTVAHFNKSAAATLRIVLVETTLYVKTSMALSKVTIILKQYINFALIDDHI
jgi:hypothetical protein